MENMVVVDQIVKKFGSFTAVNNVSLTVKKGEIFGFLGANGAGKTTLIRVLCGLISPSSGRAEVAGFSVRNEKQKIRKNIGYMSQKFSLYNDLTILENIQFYGGIYGLSDKEISMKKDEMIENLKLKEYAGKMTGELPLGFKQRLALGCALLHNLKVIFLDEPTSGVDPRVRRNFWEQIQLLAKNEKTVFVTTHFMDEAEYCNRVSIMHRGKVIAVGGPEELKNKMNKEKMEDVFIQLLKEASYD